MKIFDQAVAAVRRAVTPAVAEVEKRQGVYVSRPVLNGQDWHDWAVKWGIPEPLAADDFHVTIVYSTVNVVMIPEKTVRSIYIGPGYGDAATFAMLGPDGESLTVCFTDWDLWNRHWNYLSNGAVSKWPTYRPHMTISNAAKDFELTDAMLSDAPLYINLGPEITDELKDFKPDPADEVSDGDEEFEDGDETLIVIIELQEKEAQGILDADLKKTDHRLNAFDRYALDDIAKGRTVTRGVARRIAKAAWATDTIKAMTAQQAKKVAQLMQPAGVKKSQDVTLTVKQLSADVVKKLGGSETSMMKADEDRRLVWGIASVSTIDGEMIKDSEGDKITTEALSEFIHDLIRGQRAGKFDHVGDACNEILEALVFSEPLQKALGIDLGMEFLLTVTHVPGDEEWAMAKNGQWMQSIAGTMYYVEDEG